MPCKETKYVKEQKVIKLFIVDENCSSLIKIGENRKTSGKKGHNGRRRKKGKKEEERGGKEGKEEEKRRKKKGKRGGGKKCFSAKPTRKTRF